MSTNQPDSEQIRKYLNGELDARAMHQLEHQAQDDPFLMDALEGYEASDKNQQPNLADLKSRLHNRVLEKRKPVMVLWRVLPIAATLLIVLTFGWLWLSPKGEEAQKQQVTAVKKAPHFSIPPARLSPSMLPKEQRVIAGSTVPDDAERLANNSPAGNRVKPSYRRHRAVIKPIRIDEPTGNADVVAVTEKPAATPATDITTMAVTQFHKEAVEGRIAGTVTDAQGRAIPGARIIVKGSNTKVLSNTNGEFFLPADANKDSVTVQMMGYDTKKLLVNTTTGKLEIKLDEATNALTEVEVTHKMRPPDIHDAQPQLGWKAYKAYLKEKAVMPNGETGKVKLKFLVDTQGRISNIRVIRGRSDTMNQKAIALVVNGPEWYGDSESKLKEVKLKIKFHKG